MGSNRQWRPCPLLTGQVVPRTIVHVKTVNDVFGFWPSLDEMAADIGETHWAVKKWRTRKRIPNKAWAKVIEGAKRKGKRLTAADLLAMHSSPQYARDKVA